MDSLRHENALRDLRELIKGRKNAAEALRWLVEAMIVL